ncbi:purine-cytosine permease family protein [Chromobacterium aquaticum]|uniref:Purine-cytosine permease family protein n=1 Tax=Chromobacterium aquaticum TaxID=467180 RepID=A0ABV8ZM83_9NEIS|nr:cytosine permease [Chromobacterium aquaticum]MCD5363066.1 cytosine permease [Chromobacterium aquaticum]
MNSPPQASLIETRAIDFIPENERHGRLLSQFTLWFSANLQITAIITGALAVVLGGDVFWSLIGLLLGQVLGGAVMALHGAQGPRLGLPQMISSRVQFGVLGATLPLALVCVLYIGFNTTGTILSGQAIAQLTGLSPSAGILIFSAVIALFAACGYRMIHLLGRAATVLGLIAFAYLFARLLSVNDITPLLRNHRFAWDSFLLAVSLSASWQIAFGPYVADYSRYLPSGVSPLRTFLCVGGGSVLGAQIAMTLGVFAAALAGPRFVGQEVAYIVGLGTSGAMAGFLFFSIAFGKITVSTLNAYGSFMCLATMLSGFQREAKIDRRQRLVFVLAIVGLSAAIALAAQHDFLLHFKSFILFLLTFFTPWSAINLVDYYWVNQEQYDLAALSDPDGRYGRWNRVGIASYLFGLLAQLPFISTRFYSGPLLPYLGQVDISWLVGLIAPGALYFCLARRRVQRSPTRVSPAKG